MVVIEDFMLFIKCGEDGGEFMNNASEGYGFVVCDNCGVVIFMEEYGDAIFPYTKYCFLG